MVLIEWEKRVGKALSPVGADMVVVYHASVL
jgi:hypothetical protein